MSIRTRVTAMVGIGLCCLSLAAAEEPKPRSIDRAAYEPVVLPEPKAASKHATYWRTTITANKPKSGEYIDFGGLHVGMPSAGFSPEFELDLAAGKMSAQNVALGAEHVIIGEVTFWGHAFVSDASFPLTFQVTDAGYQYLCGRGKITLVDGKVMTIGETDTLQTWLPRCKDERLLVRQGAVQALGWLAKTPDDRSEVLPVLQECLNAEDWRIRRNAAEAIGRANLRSAAKSLEDAKKKEKSSHVVKVIEQVLEAFSSPESK